MLRRLLRFTITTFCLLSLLACLGVGWLWWRSGRVRDALEFDRRGVRREVAAEKGRVWVTNGPQLRIERAPVDEAVRRVNAIRPRVLDFGGRLLEERSHGPPGDDAGAEYQSALESSAEADRLRVDAELAYAARPKTPAIARSVSCALPAAATALPPLRWFTARVRRRWVLRRRGRLGLCPRCGYDLRGSPPGGRCGECGGADGVPA